MFYIIEFDNNLDYGEKMARKPLDKLQLALGRLIGVAKKKEKDIVETWIEMCNANGWKPSERCAQLIAWDLQQGGVDLTAVKEAKKYEKIKEAFDEASLANEIAKLSHSFAMEMIKKDMQHQQEISQLLATIRQLQQENLGLKEIKEVKQEQKSGIKSNDPNRFVSR